jgi:small subunit ribosomal protein S18
MAIRERKSNTREAAPVRRRAPEGDVTVVDVSDPEFLRRFVTEQGKILPQRISGLSAKQQRKLKLGVRRARTMGLLM